MPTATGHGSLILAQGLCDFLGRYTPILCNLPRDAHTARGAITAVTKLMIGFHVLSAYPILMNVVVLEAEEWLGLGDGAHGGGGGGDDDEDAVWGAASALGIVDAEKALLGDGKQPQDGQDYGTPSSSSTAATYADAAPAPAAGGGGRKKALRALLRASLVAVTCIIAVAIPFFGDVMSLVGAMCLTMIVFVLPVVFAWKLRGAEMSLAQKTWGVCIICCGVVGGGIGTVQAVIQISQRLRGAPEGR